MRKILLLVLVVSIVVLLWRISPMIAFFRPMPSASRIAKVFESERQSFELVSGVFVEIGTKFVSIYKTNENYRYMNAWDEVTVELYEYSDEDLFNAISLLFEKTNCSAISKERNYVSFSMWGTLDADSGITYSIDGELPDIDGEFPPARKILRFEPLGYDGWYYYYVKII
jgi:hypothetical protein